MDTQIYLNTRLLRDRVSGIREERRTAQQLLESVRRTRELSDPAVQAEYNGILTDLNALIRFFEKMEETFEQIETEAIELNRTIESMLQEGIDRTKETQRKVF